jgi:hypothetical protein
MFVTCFRDLLHRRAEARRSGIELDKISAADGWKGEPCRGAGFYTGA